MTEISSTGDAIQGTFVVRYSYQGNPATAYFSTQVPSFADNAQLSRTLISKGVRINAQSPDQGPSPSSA